MTLSSSKYTPNEIQSHLYLSFLHGYTSDVSLHVKARSWEAIYQLHRVVLIQAGFFRSLFTAGFIESQNPRGSGVAEDEVHVRFDDLNITRAGMSTSICIARLYGGGPKLYVPHTLLTTPTYPLTPAFPDNMMSFSFDHPPGHHPATPRFLLSLLATSVYLSISSVTSQALSLILSSISPYTIIRYLNFAIGKGIGPPDDSDPETAIGLEHIAKPIPSRPDSRLSITPSISTLTADSVLIESQSNIETLQKLGNGHLTGTPPFNYGGIGDKLGESCACWLLRWGADMLSLKETPLDDTRTPTNLEQTRHVFSSIWTKGGLSSAWACAVIASDDFFVKSEWDRYEFATKVLKLRYRQKSDFYSEEKEWTELFTTGIRYCHLTFDELVAISQDISPLTGQPYVSVQVIHSAHWMRSLLQHRILARPIAFVRTADSSPPPQNKDLGITVSASELSETHPSSIISSFQRPVVLYPVPNDSSQRLGDVDNAFSSGNASIDQLFGNSFTQSASETSRPPPSQSNFFGILPPCCTTLPPSDSRGKTRWSPFPPFRFGVEFWGIEDLPEKFRIHSHTSTIDPLPRPSIPPVSRVAAMISVENSHNEQPPVPRTFLPIRELNSMPSLNSIVSARAVPGSPRLSPQHPPESPTYSHFPVSSSPNHSGMSTPLVPVPIQPYRDPRMAISAHFTISCTSITGSSLTRFTSSPDQFAVSQSWGWKSSSLWPDDDDTDAFKKLKPPKESSLRAMIIIGLV
ncbi:hypothetical protein Clacol_008181 [Clathrus columnatus]|uniref:BTB domain-containing protein n=1 Tax=Clathrus columnatus TaxID=1419009 RepID=A0AAV5ALB1_9AGAM|nr:hypothetical protein Clacol_008181 [Clathrus columnatus]